MLDRLLESKSKRTRSPAGALLSVAAHTAAIAVAVYATAQAHVAPPGPSQTVRALYFPPPRQAGSSAVGSSPTRPNFPRLTIPIVVPSSIPSPLTVTPDLDLTSLVSQARDFPTGGSALSSQVAGAGAMDSGAVLSAGQVEKQVVLAAGNPAPRYPEALRGAGIEGRVIALFVVNEMGRAEDSTVRFPSADNVLFEDAVRTALHRMRFVAAEVGGRKVRQLVQMPFVFTISK